MRQSKKTKNIGIGGMVCPCCVPAKTKKQVKKLINREVRRLFKKFVRKELDKE